MPTSFREGDRLYLFSVYCGLGESTGAPIHLTDEACKRHDEMYQDMIDQGQNPYTTWNYADREFVRELESIGVTSGWREYVVNTVAKRLFALKKTILDYGDTTEVPAEAAEPAVEAATADMTKNGRKRKGEHLERESALRRLNDDEPPSITAHDPNLHDDMPGLLTDSEPFDHDTEDTEILDERTQENIPDDHELNHLIAEHGDDMEAIVQMIRNDDEDNWNMDDHVPDISDLLPDGNHHHRRGKSFLNLPHGTHSSLGSQRKRRTRRRRVEKRSLESYGQNQTSHRSA